MLIARDAVGREIDAIEISGPNAGVEGDQSGVDTGDGELKQMWHAARKSEDREVVGMAGAVPGVAHVGVRSWTMRLVTQATDTRSWEDVERRLWRLTSPDVFGGATGMFFVRFTERNGESREIQVRRTSTPEPDNKTFAGQRGHEAWTFEVTAYDPWWYGAEEHAEFHATTSQTGVVTIRNDGDLPGYLVWTFPPSSMPQTWTIPDGLGVYPAGHEQAGQRIVHTLPTIKAGDVAEADTRPYRLPFRILGQPMSFGLMRQTRWTNPLPPRSGLVELPVRVAGATDASVHVTVRPAYERPYG